MIIGGLLLTIIGVMLCSSIIGSIVGIPVVIIGILFVIYGVIGFSAKSVMTELIADIKETECKYCGEKVLKKAVKCKHCGSSLDAEDDWVTINEHILADATIDEDDFRHEIVDFQMNKNLSTAIKVFSHKTKVISVNYTIKEVMVELDGNATRLSEMELIDLTDFYIEDILD
jgi:hypothetical protein